MTLGAYIQARLGEGVELPLHLEMLPRHYNRRYCEYQRLLPARFHPIHFHRCNESTVGGDSLRSARIGGRYSAPLPESTPPIPCHCDPPPKRHDGWNGQRPRPALPPILYPKPPAAGGRRRSTRSGNAPRRTRPARPPTPRSRPALANPTLTESIRPIFCLVILPFTVPTAPLPTHLWRAQIVQCHHAGFLMTLERLEHGVQALTAYRG